MTQVLTILANTDNYTVIGGATAIITTLSGAVAYLWKRAEKEFDECKADRAKLWQALHKMGYVSDEAAE
jgi:hypothetical protein